MEGMLFEHALLGKKHFMTKYSMSTFDLLFSRDNWLLLSKKGIWMNIAATFHEWYIYLHLLYFSW